MTDRAEMGARSCDHCGRPLGAGRRRDARYCDDSCRSAARHARTALSASRGDELCKSATVSEGRQSRASELTKATPARPATAAEEVWIADLLARNPDLLRGAA